ALEAQAMGLPVVASDVASLPEVVAAGETGLLVAPDDPAALAAAMTGRVPRYGYHLPERRRGTVYVEVLDRPRQRSDWSALGCIVGREVNDYWQVPVLVAPDARPGIEDLKHLGAAL
ncbi:MAG: hypothetical protein C4289_03165, partial [Chloroflexota bacterium]